MGREVAIGVVWKSEGLQWYTDWSIRYMYALDLTILVNDQIDMIGIKIKYDCIGQFYRVKMTYYWFVTPNKVG